tara:strand:+ start:7952 stop:9061 length:1110 start_codon:yes stop_codon:yes gene_type:complete
MAHKKIMLIAGEDSGDLHGAELIKALRGSSPDYKFCGVGGDKMIKQGLVPIDHIKNLNVIGIIEVIKHYPRISKIFNKVLHYIKTEKPEKVILIDYPGFNLRLAKKISGLGIEVIYFILPQVWAWKSSRAETLNKFTDKRISIIPLEKNWFKKRNIDVSFVGNPLIELQKIQVEKEFIRKKYKISKGDKIVALMPGSRDSEIQKHWPIFLKTISLINNQKGFSIVPVLLKAPNIKIDKLPKKVISTKEDHYEILSIADAAVVCSGTATLETAILGCPMVVCYQLSAITWFLAQRMSSVEHLSLVNIISNKKIVNELLQQKMTPENILKELKFLLSKKGNETIKKEYRILTNSLRSKTNPYLEAAAHVLQ